MDMNSDMAVCINLRSPLRAPGSLQLVGVVLEYGPLFGIWYTMGVEGFQIRDPY